MPIPTRALGSEGPRVSALGLDCMGMSGAYGATDDAESIATIHAALDAGVTLIDTGDFYGMGENELLLREALRDRVREDYLLRASMQDFLQNTETQSFLHRLGER